MRKAGDQSTAQGINHERHDDRDRFGHLLGRAGRCSTHCHDDVDLQMDEVSRESGVPIILAVGPSGLESDVLTFDIAQLAQALAEGFETVLSKRVRMGKRAQITYPGYPFPRLSLSRARR